MRTVCKTNECTACHACVNICTKNAIHIEDNIKACNAVINNDLCINCQQCEKICPVNNPMKKVQPISWQQGWASDGVIRQEASSGGLAAALQRGFIENGGVVCSCVFQKGEFVFDFAYTIEEIKKFSGSKYVKSNPRHIYPEIKKLLNKGTKVLFLGLPCQCAAVKKYTKNHELLFTVDLICHGAPSPKTLKMFLTEKGYKIEEIKDIAFRKKTKYHLFVDNIGVEYPVVQDRYIMAFLNALCYTENCYACNYATVERVSDITLGDSWGSTLEESEQRKGISLILCQTEKGVSLLANSRVHVEAVDVEKAINNNRQLRQPSVKPQEYDMFYAVLQKKGNFNKAVRKCYPKGCFRQNVKSALIKLGLMRKEK